MTVNPNVSQYLKAKNDFNNHLGRMVNGQYLVKHNGVFIPNKEFVKLVPPPITILDSMQPQFNLKEENSLKYQ